MKIWSYLLQNINKGYILTRYTIICDAYSDNQQNTKGEITNEV